MIRTLKNLLEWMADSGSQLTVEASPKDRFIKMQLDTKGERGGLYRAEERIAEIRILKNPGQALEGALWELVRKTTDMQEHSRDN